MKLIINVDIPVDADSCEPRPGWLWGNELVVYAQKANLYDEDVFCALITWLESNTPFKAVDCSVVVEDCVKLIYEGPRAKA